MSSTQVGDCYLTMTSLVWCQGKIGKPNGVKVSWDEVHRIMQLPIARCVEDAQQERVIVTRGGKPIAMVIGLDDEQIQLGHDDAFWKMIEERRKQKTLTQAEFDEAVAARNKAKTKATKKSK